MSRARPDGEHNNNVEFALDRIDSYDTRLNLIAPFLAQRPEDLSSKVNSVASISWLTTPHQLGLDNWDLKTFKIVAAREDLSRVHQLLASEPFYRSRTDWRFKELQDKLNSAMTYGDSKTQLEARETLAKFLEEQARLTARRMGMNSDLIRRETVVLNHEEFVRRARSLMLHPDEIITDKTGATTAKLLGLSEKEADRFEVTPDGLAVEMGTIGLGQDGCQGSYSRRMNQMRINLEQSGSPTMAIRHELRHMDRAMRLTGWAQADRPGYLTKIQEEVASNIGTGGKRLVYFSELGVTGTPEGRFYELDAVSRVKLADTARGALQNLFLELARRNPELTDAPSNAALERFLSEPEMKQHLDVVLSDQVIKGHRNILRDELNSEFRHYIAVRDTRLIPPETIDADPVLRSEIDKIANRCKQSKIASGNSPESPADKTSELDHLLKGASSSTTGVLDYEGTYGTRSIEELHSRIAQNSEALFQMKNDFKRQLNEGQITLKELVTTEGKRLITEFKLIRNLNDIETGLQQYHSPTASLTLREEGFKKAQQAAENLLTKVLKQPGQPDHWMSQQIVSHIIERGIKSETEIRQKYPDMATYTETSSYFNCFWNWATGNGNAPLLRGYNQVRTSGPGSETTRTLNGTSATGANHDTSVEHLINRRVQRLQSTTGGLTSVPLPVVRCKRPDGTSTLAAAGADAASFAEVSHNHDRNKALEKQIEEKGATVKDSTQKEKEKGKELPPERRLNMTSEREVSTFGKASRGAGIAITMGMLAEQLMRLVEQPDPPAKSQSTPTVR